jgi:hypothetical protein
MTSEKKYADCRLIFNPDWKLIYCSIRKGNGTYEDLSDLSPLNIVSWLKTSRWDGFNVTIDQHNQNNNTVIVLRFLVDKKATDLIRMILRNY